MLVVAMNIIRDAQGGLSCGWSSEESTLVFFPRYAGGIALTVVFSIPTKIMMLRIVERRKV